MAINLVAQVDSSSYSIAQKHNIYSEILSENREILIHVPQGFWGMDEKLDNYPVTIVLDGESQFLHTVSAIDFLSSAPMGNDLMPRTIVVGIPNTNRNRDLTPTKGVIGTDSSSLKITGGGKDFLKFITKELIPYLDNHFSTNNHRTIIGHSLGGLIVFEALLNEREYFTNYLAIDPGINYDNESYLNRILDTLQSTDLREENLFLAKANTFPSFLNSENLQDDDAEITKITRSNQKMLKIAKSNDWNINYSFVDFPKENHFSVPYWANYEGMRFFYQYFPFEEMIDYCHPSFKEKTDLVDKIKKHYQEISKHIGYSIIPLESYLKAWAHGFSHFDRVDLSFDLFDYIIELYPNNPSTYNSKAYLMIEQDNVNEAIRLFRISLSLKEDKEIRKKMEEIINYGN